MSPIRLFVSRWRGPLILVLALLLAVPYSNGAPTTEFESGSSTIHWSGTGTVIASFTFTSGAPVVVDEVRVYPCIVSSTDAVLEFPATR